MALYLIGDVQGCDGPLQQLLDRIAFSPSRDTLYLLGDLVNRGPASLQVLRRLMGLGGSAHCLLGNHDLHLLALAGGVREPRRSDTLQAVLQAPDRAALLGWLRRRPLALLERVFGQDVLMVHAGVLPSWSASFTMARAHEVQQMLRGPQPEMLLRSMYGDTPICWHDGLQGQDRLRAIINVLTRLRFCTDDGAMEFHSKEAADAAPPGYRPWFDVPGRQTEAITVAFGHWSTLGWLGRRNVLAMDTGCVWGGCLSAARLTAPGPDGSLGIELLQQPCVQAQVPG